MNNTDLSSMSRGELILLQGEISEKLKEHRPYRIRERMIRCGKSECWCANGSEGHGPYLNVVYREEGKTRSVSIGPKLTFDEMMAGVPGLPAIFEFLTVPDHKYQAMSRSETDDWVYVTLSSKQFEQRHGLSEAEDMFNRPKKFWGPRYEYQRFEGEYALALQMQEIPYNQWSGYGVSTLAGIAVLEQLEARNYYLKV